MILNGHKKHSDLARPANGNFCRNEWAILGAPCEVIKNLSSQIIKPLSTQYKCGYADSTHNDEESELPGSLASGATAEYTDYSNYAEVNYKAAITPFKQRALFSEMDLMLVNGNHQQAKAQVVIIDGSKKASLQKRVHQLTNVQLILLADGMDEHFDFVKDAIPNWQQIPVYRLNDDTEKIIDFFKNKLIDAVPVLNGLVLAGGKSTRMGKDKGSINWHGKEQRYHVADLLKEYCSNVFISCRDERQAGEVEPGYPTITDTFTGLGPYSAILSAFREQPDNAWLVIACDLPLVDSEVMKYLVNHRNPSSIATAYQSQVSDFPEPLITIYEPKSYPALLQFLAQGYSCPRKALINSDVTILQAQMPNALYNVNTSEDMERVEGIIKSKSMSDAI